MKKKLAPRNNDSLASSSNRLKRNEINLKSKFTKKFIFYSIMPAFREKQQIKMLTLSKPQFL